MIDIKQYLEQTNTVLLTKDAFEYLKERASVSDKVKAEYDPSADLISREKTLTAFADYVGSGMSMDDYDALWDIVAKMPAVKQEPKFIAKSDGTIEQIKNCDDCLFKKEWGKIGKLISVVLEKQTEQEPCDVPDINVGDMISRQAVLDKKELVELEDGQSFYCISPEDVETLPSVNPMPCEDAIDRAEAIKIASGYCHPANVAKELAKLPSVNPQPCEDAISRQAVLDIVDSYSESQSNVEDVTQDIISDIMALPPVTPQPKTGHWIFDDECKEHGHCSRCGYGSVDLVDGESHNFCRNCGAWMVEPQERSEEE